jgi:hypothetical protein
VRRERVELAEVQAVNRAPHPVSATTHTSHNEAPRGGRAVEPDRTESWRCRRCVLGAGRWPPGDCGGGRDRGQRCARRAWDTDQREVLRRPALPQRPL